jgi:thioredoxin reductase (NADPH)
MITVAELSDLELFSECGEEQKLFFAKNSADIRLSEGDWVIREGESPRYFVLLSGTAEVIKEMGGRRVTLTTYTAGDAFGEVPLMLGASAVASVHATSDVRLARVDAATFWRLMHDAPCFAKTVSANMAKRVAWVQQVSIETPQAQCIVEGDSRSPACYELRDFLTRMHIVYEWEERDGETCELHFPDGTTLHSPSVRQLAEKLGLSLVPHRSCYDVAIVGAGPAGLAAAVYGASEGLKTLLIDRFAPGGQAGMSSRIENYLGFPTGVSGEELADRALHQAQRFGVDIVVLREVCGLDGAAGERHLTLDDGQTIRARTVVLSPGVTYRSLPADGCSDFLNHGVYYGAAQAEASQVSGKDIHLVGGGNSAGQAALHFADYAQSVTIVIRGNDIRKDMSNYLVDRVTSARNIRILTRTEVKAVNGNDRLEQVTLDNAGNGSTSERSDGLFVFIGAVPKTEWIGDFVARDERGFLLTGTAAAASGNGWTLDRPPHFLETNQRGIYAAGDARRDSIKRVAAGVGEGSCAIALIHTYLGELTAQT